MNNEQVMRVGGYFLIALALLWVGLIVLFDIVFGFPAMLQQMPAESLTALLSRGPGLRISLTFYSLVPLLLIPGSVAGYYALRDTAEGAMRVAMQFALLSVLAAVFGLMVWSGINWHLATFLVHLKPAEYPPILAVLFSLNYFLRLFVGEYLAQTCLCIWILITSTAIIRDKGFPSWYGIIGWIIAVIVLLALLLRAASIAVIPDIFIELVPISALWVFLFGVGILVHKT